MWQKATDHPDNPLRRDRQDIPMRQSVSAEVIKRTKAKERRLMAGHVSQNVFIQIFSQRQTVELCLQSCKTTKSIILSPHTLPDYSASRSESVEKLIDKPICFWFYEEQVSSNIHRKLSRRGERRQQHRDQEGLRPTSR